MLPKASFNAIIRIAAHLSIVFGNFARMVVKSIYLSSFYLCGGLNGKNPQRLIYLVSSRWTCFERGEYDFVGVGILVLRRQKPTPSPVSSLCLVL